MNKVFDLIDEKITNLAKARSLLSTLPEIEFPTSKNPIAIILGRRGGLKGGPARAIKLTQQRRSEIASNAAKKRWEKAKSEKVTKA